MRYEAMEEHSLGRKSTLKVREVFWGPYQSSRAGLVTRKDVCAEDTGGGYRLNMLCNVLIVAVVFLTVFAVFLTALAVSWIVLALFLCAWVV